MKTMWNFELCGTMWVVFPFKMEQVGTHGWMHPPFFVDLKAFGFGRWPYVEASKNGST